MKGNVFWSLAILFSMITSISMAQEGIGTNQPDKSSALEILSTKRGLLIPRLDIPDLNQGNPVTNPAHSLLVYNTGDSGTLSGFYYWNSKANDNSGAWIPIAQMEGGGNQMEWTGIGLINVDNDQSEISLLPGEDGQMLVSRLDPETNEIQPVWTDLTEFSQDSIRAENGLSLLRNPDELVLKLGGDLSEDTFLNTLDNDLYITGLVVVDSLEIPQHNILSMDDEGKLALVPVSHFLAGATVDMEAGSGLHFEDGQLHLGGDLTKPAILVTDEENSLGIQGLQEVKEVNKLLVIGESDGIVQQLTHSISEILSSSTNLGSISNYSPYILEVNVEVDINGLNQGDINLDLPNASEANGQIFSIKLSGGDEASNYLNIREGNTILIYGALPHQGWIIKSNGSRWDVIARN